MHLVHQVVDLLLPFGGLVTEALRSSPSSGTAFDIGDGASVNDELASVVAAGLTSGALLERVFLGNQGNGGGSSSQNGGRRGTALMWFLSSLNDPAVQMQRQIAGVGEKARASLERVLPSMSATFRTAYDAEKHRAQFAPRSEVGSGSGGNAFGGGFGRCCRMTRRPDGRPPGRG